MMNEDYENNFVKFKNVDVIGYFGVEVFNQFVLFLGYFCEGVGMVFMLYLFSILDMFVWCYNVFEMVYLEVLIFGMCEVGVCIMMNFWGNVYFCGGFLYQIDDYKLGVVVVQCVGDVVMCCGQLYVYQLLFVNVCDGYWFVSVLMEGDVLIGKWQEFMFVLFLFCMVFLCIGFLIQVQ